MTTFGNVVDAASTMPSAVAEARTVRPSLLPKEESQLATGVVRKPRLDDHDARSLEEQWTNSVRAELKKSLRISVQHPASMTAAARLAEAALLAGEKAQAIEASIKTLALGVERYCDPSASVRSDVTAVYLAAQVLIRLGEEPVAQDYLRTFKNVPMLAYLYAAIIASDSRHDEALAILQDLDAEQAPAAAGLRGYLHAVSGDHARAVSEFRLAQAVDPEDSDAAVNLAVAFWKLGSPKKAIQAARRAVRVAPSKTSVAVTLLWYLVATHQFDSAVGEIKKLREIGAVESVDLLVVESYTAAEMGKTATALALLRKAQSASRASGNVTESASVEGRIAAFEFHCGKSDRAEALQKIRSALRRAPESPLLVALLAELVDKRSAAGEVERALTRVDRSIDPSLSRSASCRLAYLKGELDDACQQALAWSQDEPLNEKALRLSVFWDGGLNQEWSKSADRASALCRKIGPIPSLVNAAAYSLAFAGRGREALPLLAKVAERDLVLMATEGLVNLSIGNVREGFDLYRRAANRADQEERARYIRLIMTIHQAMGIRHFGIQQTHTALLRAASLPAVELPSNWKEDPELVFLSEVAKRSGWPWPVVID